MKAFKRIATLTVWMMVTILSWSQTVVLECENLALFDRYYSYEINSSTPCFIHSITDENRNPNVIGTISNNAYFQLLAYSWSASPQINFRLFHPDIDGGFWDIYVVTVPEEMDDTLNIQPKRFRFQASLTQDKNTVVNYGDKYETTIGKVDTFLVMENVKLSNLTDMHLKIYSKRSIKEVSMFHNEPYLDCFILKKHPSYKLTDNRFEQGGLVYKITGEQNVTVFYANEKKGAFAIPSEVEHDGQTYSVTGIDYVAFQHCKELTELTIPRSVKSIDKTAIAECTSLHSIKVEEGNESFTSIDGMLYSKDGHTLIICPRNKHGVCHLPESTTIIQQNAFRFCSKIEDLVIPNSLQYLEENALYQSNISHVTFQCEQVKNWFMGYAPLRSITLTDSVRSLDYRAFQNCLHFEHITWSNNLTDIYYYAFAECPIQELNLPKSVKGISNLAFSEYKRLKKVSLPCQFKKLYDSSIETFDADIHRIFDQCDSIESVYLNSDFNEGLFKNKPLLKYIEIGDSVKSINKTFDGCKSLESVIIPHHVKGIYGGFANCTNLTDVILNEGIEVIGPSAFANCGLRSIRIPESTTHIKENAFAGCQQLNHIEVPNSVICISNGALSGTAWYERQPEGLIYLNKVAYAYKGDMPENTTLTFRDDTKGLGNFSDKNLVGVIIPSKVEYIDGFANSGIREIIVPANVKSIGNSAFYACKDLKVASIMGSETKFSQWTYSFRDINMDSIYLNTRTIDKEVFNFAPSVISPSYEDYGANIKSIALGDSVRTINNGAFAYCHFQRIHFGKNVRTIGQSAFLRNTLLKEVELPEGIETIDYSIFDYCDSLKNIHLPSTLKLIRSYAFSTRSLENVYIKATIPPTAESQAILAYRSQATLHVPAGCKEAYEAAEVWKDFNIVEDETTDIHAVQNASPSTESETWYDLQGRKIATPGKGIYIVRDGKRTRKVQR